MTGRRKDEETTVLRRNPFLGPWPAGLMGMLGLVLAVELYVARHDRDYTTHWAQAWKWSGQASAREAKRSEILCFGDSLVLHGVLPNVIEDRLHRKAYNLAVFKGQAPANYFLLRRALDSGAKPAAVLVDGELLEEDPMPLNRLWPELASLYDCGELALAARAPEFFGAMAVSKLLPTFKARWEIRSSIMLTLAGKTPPDRTEIRPRKRNADQNRGAQVLATYDGPDPRGTTIAQYQPTPWKAHPLNAAFTEKFLRLATSRGIPVYWLLPPYYPGIQDRRERGGWDAGYMAFVRSLQARYANLIVIDGRHAGYAPDAIADLTHLNRLGAVAFSDAVAVVLQSRLGGGRTKSPNRWVAISQYHPSVDAIAIEDVMGSADALRRGRAGKGKVRR